MIVRSRPYDITLAELTERAQYLLKALTERYIREGQPVGSRVLARDAGLKLSPATIRNVIADLEELGLVRSPHTSSGRVPTVQGYRLFVDTLLSPIGLQGRAIGAILFASLLPLALCCGGFWEVATRALQYRAAAVIFAHNHPSGVAEPSSADRRITERLCAALALLDIRVLDHVIIGRGREFSFAREGLI